MSSKSPNVYSGKISSYSLTVHGQGCVHRKKTEGETEVQVKDGLCTWGKTLSSSKGGQAWFHLRAVHSCLPKRKEVVTCSYHVIRKRCLQVVITDHVGLTLFYFIQRKPHIPVRVRTAVYITHITSKNIDVYICIMERDTMFAFQGFSPKS